MASNKKEVDSSQESQIDELALEIGQGIRTLRTAAGLSGRKLAAAAGISQPFLSQLELGQTSAAIATLYRIANALNTTPAQLLPRTPAVEVELVRAPKARRPVSDDLSAASARATFRGGKGITELYDYVIEPGEYVEEWFESSTEQAVYVLAGAIRVEFEVRPDIIVETGDMLFYQARLRHRWHLHSDAAARVILVAVTI